MRPANCWPPVQNRSDTIPADAVILMVPGPVDDQRLAQDFFHRDKPPEPAAVTLVPVVPHDEEGIFRNRDRSEVVAGLDRSGDDQVVHINPVGVAPGEAVQDDLLVPDLDGVSRQADQALDEILRPVFGIDENHDITPFGRPDRDKSGADQRQSDPIVQDPPLIMLGLVLVTVAPARTAKFAVLAGAVGGTVGQGVAKLVLFCNSVGI